MENKIVPRQVKTDERTGSAIIFGIIDKLGHDNFKKLTISFVADETKKTHLLYLPSTQVPGRCRKRIITPYHLNVIDPIVTLGPAKIIGTFMHTRKDRQVSAFLGIPYAEPPTGDLRFRNPIAKKPLSGTILAYEEGNMCLQYAAGTTNKVGDENCLFLNVYTPLVPKNQGTKLLPVMVYIHGGAYVYGSSNSTQFGPDYLLDKDVVLVTMNYRVGIFGFLSTGDVEAPGNFGLKDQVLALRWVQKNIRHFGGNPDKVTIFGLSAGSNCVQFHALSDASTGLFHQYIMESGHAISPRSFKKRESYSEFARAAGNKFGCTSKNSQLLVNCLRNVEGKRLLDSISIFDEIQVFLEATWTPTDEPDIDGAFITDSPYNLMKKGKQKDYPWIHGMAKDEGLYFMKNLYTNNTFYEKVVGDFEKFLVDIFITFPLPGDLSQIVHDVKEFYFGGNVMQNKNLILRQIVKFIGDLFRYRYEFILADQHTERAKQPLFLYSFEYRGTISMSALIGNNSNVGVSHGDESLYIFPLGNVIYEAFNVTMSEVDSKIADTMVDLWTSFATDGAPKTNLNNSNVWKPYSPGHNILKIGDDSKSDLSIIHSLFKERMDFWSSRIPKSL